MRSQLSCGFILFAAFLFAQTNIVKSANVVYCYWGTWSYYRPGNGQFQVSDFDPNLCTHIGYAFFGLRNDRIASLDSWLDFDLGTIAKTVALKQRNPNLKVMASIGGYKEGSATYSAMAASPQRRATFIASVVDFLYQHNFDGLDLDWEYPAQRGGSAADRTNFVTLLSELNTALKANGFLLTIAVAAGETSASTSYDIANVAKHVDLINLMAYDFAGSWEPQAGFNAPLQGQGQNNVKSAVEYWLRSGAPANKLVMGMGMYGRSFTLSNSAQNTAGAPTTGGGNAGPITQEPGYLGYNEICQNLKSGWTRKWDSAHQVPYAYSGNQWVGYDDEESLNHKINYLKSRNLAGAMIWSIETEDFRGLCGEKYPLLKTIKNGVSGSNGGTAPNVPTPAPGTPATTRTTRPPTQATPPSNTGNCQKDGMFVNLSDCNRFYQCFNGQRYDYACSPGLYFDQLSGACNWPQLVNCNP